MKYKVPIINHTCVWAARDFEISLLSRRECTQCYTSRMLSLGVNRLSGEVNGHLRSAW
jgi:hypothetical protein